MPEMQIRGGLTRGNLREKLEKGITGHMNIMGSKGDTRVTWNARDADEVAAARRQFDDLRERGFLAYRVEEGSGGKGEQIREFDPQAQKIILAPPMAGG